MITNDGVRKDDKGKFIFDKKTDLTTDIIELTKDISGQKITNNLTYFYAYEFKEGTDRDLQRDFRNALKHKISDDSFFYSDELFDFVEDGVFRLDKYKRIDEFKVMITTQPTTDDNTLLNLVETLITDYSTTSFVSFKLIKKLIEEVTFDPEKAANALRNTKKYSNEGEASIRSAVNSIIRKIKQQNPKDVFQIKRFNPVVARVGFSNFLKFKNEWDERTYRNLENGTDILVADDFVTSGSTLKEMIDLLTSVNPNNKITAFAFINQLREY